MNLLRNLLVEVSYLDTVGMVVGQFRVLALQILGPAGSGSGPISPPLFSGSETQNLPDLVLGCGFHPRMTDGGPK
jgi:hypothetical protein